MAGVSVKINLDRYEISLADSARLTVSVSGTKSSETPKIKGLDNFIVESGGTSSQVQIINGQFSSSVEYSYFLQPKAVGNFQVGPAAVEVDGRVYASNTENLSVKKAAGESGSEESPIFLTASLSSTRVYTEEQILYVLKLYYAVDASNFSISSLPDDPNLSIKQLGKDIRYETKYNNRAYSVIELRFALIPSRLGTYNINPVRMSMAVPQRGRSRRAFNPFEDFFSSARGRPVTVESKPLTLEVFPVPEKGKPSDFAGLVGEFTISSTLEPGSIKTGESATLTVIVRGRGNINRMPDLSLPEIENIKTYGDQPVLETGQDEKGIQGVKTMKWAIVPQKEGQYKIPPVSISYFDAKKQAYTQIKSSTHSLTVLSGAGGMDSIASLNEKYKSRADRKTVEVIGKDILPVHASVTDLSSSEEFSPGWISIILLTFPIIAYFAMYGGLRIIRRTPQKESSGKAGKAAKIFIKSANSKDMTPQKILNAMRDYINSRFDMKHGLLTQIETGKLLSERGCSDETLKEVESLLHELENAVYTGQGDKAFNPGVDLKKLINRIERESR